MNKHKQVKCPRAWANNTAEGIDCYAYGLKRQCVTPKAVRIVPESEFRRLRKIEREYLKIIEDPFWRLNK